MSRQKKIIRTSITGIAVNLILVAFKATVGILTNSIAITMDAVNNLTDALSSIITIIGIQFSLKAPDKRHPYGYGRIEFFSSVIIAAIVLWAGTTAFMESWPKIFSPDVTSYTTVSLIIIAVAVVVKIVLGRYFLGVGNEVNSQALVASGKDALFDALLSLSTLVAAIVSMVWHISLEGILGTLISLVILKAGIDMLNESVDILVGARIDADLARRLKDTIFEFPEVHGAYDLSLHNYGTEDMWGSVHIEVDDTMSALEIHKLSRNISEKVYNDFSIILTPGIYARNNRYSEIRDEIERIAGEYDDVIEVHGFIVYEDEKLITFDLIVDFKGDREKIKEEIISKIKAEYPEFDYFIIDDYDISD